MSRHHDSGDVRLRAWLRGPCARLLVLILIPLWLRAAEMAAGPSAADAAAGVSAVEAAAGPSTGADPGMSSGSAGYGSLPRTGDTILVLDVVINDEPIGKIGEFTMRSGRLMAPPEELRDMGFRLPPSYAEQRGGLVALSALPGLTWKVDQKAMVLYVKIDNSGRLPTLLPAMARTSAEEHRVIESGTGATLNYDAVGTFARGQAGVNGLLDVRAFSPRGTLSSGWLGYAGAASNTSLSNTAIRLDTTYSFADVNSLRRYSLGDFITSGVAWTRPVRLEGFQIRSDFSMRPDLVTFPLPSINGSAAVPSTVSVLADGNLVTSSEVGAGPFSVPQLPVVSGAGTISMTMVDARGQQVTVSQPFYASTELLAPGLQTFAAQAGLVRRNWGVASYDYGRVAGTAMYRRGLTSKFTVEGSVEGAPGVFLGGGGGVLQVGHLGVLNFSAAGSSGQGRSGAQVSAGAQRIGRVFSLGALATLATRDYRDVASLEGAGVPRRQFSGFTGLSLRRFGSLGAAYASIDHDIVPVASVSWTPEHSRVLSCSYSLQIHHVSFYVSGYRNLTDGGSKGLQAGLTFSLGRRRSAQISGSSDGSAQVQVQQSATRVGEWGYQAYVSTGNGNHDFGQVEYKSPVGLFSAGVDTFAGNTTGRLQSRGALSFVDKGLFASNTIYDSFAIVDTGSLPRVHVLQENREVGMTNESGRLLVPDMRSFDANHLAIRATDIPADVTLSDPSRIIRPQDRSGVVVKFPFTFSDGALLRLVDGSGNPIPLGSTATLIDTGAVAPVGYDGQAYIENLSPHNELSVERPDGRRCTVTFDYQPTRGDIPLIGPLRCMENKR